MPEIEYQENLKLISFNCKSVKTSSEDIHRLCETADLIALQETWLLPFDISFLGSIHEDVEYTGKSAVDISSGILKGRPYGGVAILWRKGIFQSVSVVDCDCSRITAIKASLGECSILVFSVYMPTNSEDNLPIFTECLSVISAIVESSDVEAVYILGDFNAHPGELFCNELLNFCVEQSWLCADLELLGTSHDCHTFVSDAHGSKRWLDHCVVSQCAWRTVLDVCVDYNVYCSDHLPLVIKCNISTIRTKRLQSVQECNK